jgi:hypothetical protein
MNDGFRACMASGRRSTCGTVSFLATQEHGERCAGDGLHHSAVCRVPSI